MNDPLDHRPLTTVETRALVGVAADLADDFGIECAIVVIDGDGVPRAVDRPQTVPGPVLDEAMRSARTALSEAGDGPTAGGGSAGVLIEDGARGVRGALGIAGGPEGFALEACRVAARALGFGGDGRLRTFEDLTA